MTEGYEEMMESIRPLGKSVSKFNKMHLIAFALVPIVVWFVLYYSNAKIVQKEQDGTYKTNKTKVSILTIIATAVVWALIYMYIRKQ